MNYLQNTVDNTDVAVYTKYILEKNIKLLNNKIYKQWS